jgi:hypothetical protein
VGAAVGQFPHGEFGRFAVRESPRTTKLYRRTADEITLNEMQQFLAWLRYVAAVKERGP